MLLLKVITKFSFSLMMSEIEGENTIIFIVLLLVEKHDIHIKPKCYKLEHLGKLVV